MPHAQALSSAFGAPVGARDSSFGPQIADPGEQSMRPIKGLLGPGELPAGMIGATTVSALLSGVPGSTLVPFAGHLRDLCDNLAARLSTSGGPRLTCEAAAEALPMSTATILELIAEVLVTDAFVHGFPPARSGRIAVSFTAGPEAWQLTVDDSGIAGEPHGHPRDDNLTIVRQLVLRVGGRLTLPKVTGGTRCVVTLPRRRSEEGTDFGHPRTTASRPESPETEIVPLLLSWRFRSADL